MYQGLGCDTLQYILPTRFIFRHTEQVHQAVEEVAKYLKQRGLSQPTAVHCLSDTGCMCFQGLNIATFSQGFPLTPRGVVWDSCPGPRPVVTIPKGLVLCIINWLSRMRDGMSVGKAVATRSVQARGQKQIKMFGTNLVDLVIFSNIIDSVTMISECSPGRTT